MLKTMPRVLFIVLVVLTSCKPNQGEYTPEPPVNPPLQTGVRIEDIGIPCVYDPATGASPTLQCARGTTCFINTPDGTYTPTGVRNDAMLLPAWEDHFTTPLSDGATMGFCTVINQPDACPAGSRAKAFTGTAGFFTACIRICENDLNCPRLADVCDARFFDDDGSDGGVGNEGACVRKCQTDLPDCVRSGVDVANRRPVLYSEDAFGDAQCNQDTGRCAHGISKGTGTLGERCLSSSQCAEGSICMQGSLFDTEFGFCASPALSDPQSPTLSTCSPGSVPQPGLSFGNWIPQLVVDFDPLSVIAQVGYCFFQCQVDGAQICNAYEGTVCGNADPAALQLPGPGDAPLSMCLPDIIRIE
jgi:hypothetical protein